VLIHTRLVLIADRKRCAKIRGVMIEVGGKLMTPEEVNALIAGNVDEHGVDVSVIDIFLCLTPEQRLQACANLSKFVTDARRNTGGSMQQ